MKTLKLPQELIEATAILPSTLRAEVYDIVIRYISSGTEPDETTSPEARAIFLLSRKSIDRANRTSTKKAINPAENEQLPQQHQPSPQKQSQRIKLSKLIQRIPKVTISRHRHKHPIIINRKLPSKRHAC